MPIVNRGSATAVATNVSTEGPALTLNPVQDVTPYGTVIVSGNLNVTAGTGTTAVVVKVRQGSGTGGTQVGPSFTVTLAAGASTTIPVEVEDTASVSGLQYTVTVTQTGGTAAGTVNYAYAKCTSVQGVAA